MSCTSRTATLLVGVTGVLVLGSSTAFAVWTTTGTGTGSATATTFTPPTLTAGTATGDLYPGLTADGSTTGGSLAVVAGNPNPFPIMVTVSQGPAAPSGCDTTGVTLLTTSFGLAANQPPTARLLKHVVSMSTASTSDCQGKAITVPLATTATSA